MGKRLTLEHVREVIEAKGFKLLSTEYINAHSKLLLECSQSHRWEATFTSIKGSPSRPEGTGCPVCAGSQKLSINHVREVIEKKGFKLLSTEYINNHSKLLFECSQGHRWEATFASIKGSPSYPKGNGCPECAGIKKLSIEHVREVIHARGFKLFSTEYKNNSSKLLLECSHGHSWEACFSDIQGGHGCPVCGGTQKLTFNQVREVIEAKGFKLLSTEYINANSKLLLECSQGHRWEVPFTSVKGSPRRPQGTGCPECSCVRNSLPERVCRWLLEQYLGVEFYTAYPDWLGSEDGGRGLELDAYSEKLGLALEYQGEQHYKDVEMFRRGNEGLPQRQARDRLKRKLCEQQGVCLLQVDYVWKIPELPQVVFNLLKNVGFQPLCSPDQINLNDIEFSGYKSGEDLLEIIRLFVDKYGCVPTHATWKKFVQNTKWFSSTTYVFRFGSWSEAIRLAGYTPQPVGSVPQYTKSGALGSLIYFRIYTGHFPKCKEWEAHAKGVKDLPSASTISTRFSSWSNAIKQAEEKYKELFPLPTPVHFPPDLPQISQKTS